MGNFIVSPTLLKQEAKKLKKEKGISHAEALDEVAKLHDFSGGWKHYLNVWEAFNDRPKDEMPIPSKEEFLKGILQEKSHSKKVDLAISYVHTGKMPLQDMLKVLELFQDSDEDVQYICVQSTLEGEIRRKLLNYFEESKDDVQLLPGREHFIAKNVIVKNLSYSMFEGELNIMGSYTLEFGFEHEVEDQYKDLPHFRREPMTGHFDITITEDGEIEIENPSIGESNEDGFFMFPFKSADPEKLRQMRDEIKRS